MARAFYGCTSADFTLTAGGRLSPGAVLTLWTARTGGTRITDLLTVDGTPITEVVSGADASIAYQGPDNDKSVHWADSGQGARTAIRPVDITGEPNSLSVGTVTTGAAGSSAAVTITGDAPSQTVNLTIPQGATGPAGASVGVLTTKGDLLVRDAGAGVRLPVGLDGTVLLADSAQAAGVGWGSLGNLLTANQAQPTTLGGWPLVGGTETAPGVYQASGTGALNMYLPAGQAIPVTPGQTYTAYAKVTCVGRTTSVRIRWMTSGNADISNSQGPQVTSGVSQVTAIAPSNAAKAMVYASNSPTGAAGDTITVHEAGFWRGAGGMWQPPGLPISALSPWIVESATSGRACFVWDQVNSRPQMVYYDSGWRDISSLLLNGWTGSLFIRRADNMVMLRTSGLSGAGATSDTIATIPSGFRLEATISQILPANATDATVVRAQMTSAGVLTMARATVTAQSATWSMSTTNAL